MSAFTEKTNGILTLFFTQPVVIGFEGVMGKKLTACSILCMTYTEVKECWIKTKIKMFLRYN